MNNTNNQTTKNLVQTANPSKKHWHFSAAKVLYAIGGITTFIGIIFFVARIWNDIGIIGHIGVTLGIGLLLTFLGSFLIKKNEKHLGLTFYLLGGILTSGGMTLSIIELAEKEILPQTTVGILWSAAIGYGLLFAIHLLLTLYSKHFIATFFTVSFATTTIYLTAFALLFRAAAASGVVETTIRLLTLAVGMSYILLGYKFRNSWNQRLTAVFYLLGSIAVFSSFWYWFRGWVLLSLISVIGGFLLSLFLKSRSIFFITTLFLIADIIYITGRYFIYSLGWPITLIISGILIMGIGYAAITVSKKYIADN